MAASQKDSFSDLERLLARLQEQLATARKGLLHWQKWDADYESLKEQALATTAPEALRSIGSSFSGLAIPSKEVDEILYAEGGGKTRRQRTRDEVVGVLDRRLDYVGKNVETLGRQVDALEEKIGKVEILLNPDVMDGDGEGGEDAEGEGLPLTEIVEELDEHDNVVSVRLQRPGDAGPGIRDVLRRVGVEVPEGGDEEKEEGEKEEGEDGEIQPNGRQTNTATGGSTQPNGAAVQEATQQMDRLQLEKQTPAPPSPADDHKPSKGVSFAQDTKPGHDPISEPVSEPVSEPRSKNARMVGKIMRVAKDQEAVSRKRAVLPADESEDDVELRREMLQYTMGEVGAVVAELEIEEGDDDDDDDDDLEYDLTEDEDKDEDEDKWGRNKNSFIDEDYRERMRELEQMYGVQSRFTRGGDEDQERDVKTEGIGRIVVKQDAKQDARQDGNTASTKLAMGTKDKASAEEATTPKSVRFAEELNIAPSTQVATATTTTTNSATDTPAPAPFVDPTSDVTERPAGPPSTSQQKSRRKASRFKQSSTRPSNPDDAFFPPPKGPLDAPARFLDKNQQPGGEPAPTPTGPAGRTLADVVVEKEPAPPPADGGLGDDGDGTFDGTTEQELRAEHHRLRNKFIHRHGGFLREDTREVRPLDEEEGGAPRISRFKAARLSAVP